MTGSDPISPAANADDSSPVEVRRLGEFIEVRDSRDGDDGPVLRFTPAEWRAWLDGARKGEFDHLAQLGQPDQPA
jgi:hypothetical protein